MKRQTTLAFFLFAGLFIKFKSQDYSKIVERHFAGQHKAQNSGADLSHREFKITNADPSESMHATVLSVQQAISGVPVMYSDAILVVRDNQVVAETDNFQKLDAESASLSAKPSLSAQAAFATTGKGSAVPSKSVGEGRLYFYPVGSRLVLSYVYIFNEGDLEKMLVVDANTGAVLHDAVTTLSCHFEENSFNIHEPEPTVLNESMTKSAAVPGGAAYNVFALPLESPNFGARSVVTSPWILESSPVGWHNDGSNEYNTTRGNNVYAYDDSSGSNSPGDSPLQPNRVFDFPVNLDDNAKNYKNAAITNLFYASNMAHDIFYQYGFTETAKNMQATNFGKGGSGGDYVRAEAQDGGGLDNANFSPAYDGSLSLYPRMQMYLWSPKMIQNIFIKSPDQEAGKLIPSKLASFGPSLETNPVVGNLVLSQPLDGCAAITNSADMAGNIAVIERGTCNFTAKVKNAQTAGAKAVVVYNALASSTFGTMGGTDTTVTIPSILITKQDGDYIKNLMAQQTVKVSLEDDKSKYKYIDGALDNGIVIHEYGHGVTNRMTGIGLGCLDKTKSAEQMGEGWSDYFAMMMTYIPGDKPQISRGIGTFASAQGADDVGIRPAKYSSDFKINPYTYAKTNGMTFKDANGVEQIDVHSIGFVYGTILWDMTLKLIEKYGYEPNLLKSKTSGNARAMQMVMDALKLQGCNPTFIDGRDAIIKADMLANQGENECLIWSAFAKRGVGEKASAGDKTNIKDQVEDFTIPAKCVAMMATADHAGTKAVSLFPNPASNEFYIKTGPVSGKILVTIYDMAGNILSKSSIKDGEPVPVKSLPNGVYTVNAESISFKTSQKLIIKH